MLALISLTVAATTFDGWTFYTGDPHVHTGHSGDGGSSDLGDCPEGCGAFADLSALARSNGLDWMAVSDHINGGAAASTEEYATLTSYILENNDPEGGLLLIPAAEVWFGETMEVLYGHKTLLLFGTDADLADLSLHQVQPNGDASFLYLDGCSRIPLWMQALTSNFGDALLIPHHPAVVTPMPTDWNCSFPAYEPAVEIYSEHGNALVDADYDPPWSGTEASGAVSVAFGDHGLRMGFLGGTDSHDTRPGGVCELDSVRIEHPYGGGLTIAALPEGEVFDRDTLYQAIVERRTMATTGPILPFSVRYDSGGATLGTLGQEFEVGADQNLDVTVSLPEGVEAAVTAVDVVWAEGRWSGVAQDATTWTITVPAAELPPWLYVEVVVDGDVWYGAGACVDGGDTAEERIWGSPSWLSVGVGDADGDGFTVDEGDCDDGAITVYPGAHEVWYDGLDQDCDGNDTDQDGDGVAGEDVGGSDCDDLDPTISPDEPEVWYDGIDQDCSGGGDNDQDGDGAPYPDDCDDADPVVQVCPVAETPEKADPPPSRCGCGTPGVSWLGLFGALALRRRR